MAEDDTTRFQINPKARNALARLVQTGTYGSTATEVCEALVMEGLRRALARGFIAPDVFRDPAERCPPSPPSPARPRPR